MKTLRKLLPALVLAGAAGLVGCANMPPNVTRESPPGVHVVDRAYVQAVERVARKRGIAVQWVNAPDRPGEGSNN